MKRLRLYSGLLLAALCVKLSVFAQQQIDIQTSHTSLVFTVAPDHKLYQSYLGKKLSNTTTGAANSTQFESYAPGGGSYLFEPAIRMVHTDGNPSLDLRVANVQTTHPDKNNTVTCIVLKDSVYPVTVQLFISAYEKEDVIQSWTVISHQEKKPVRLTHFASSMLHFQATNYWLTHFHGDWAEEMHEEENKLTSGIKIIDSKLGSRAHMYQTPAFLLSLNDKATETEGELVAGTLAWSGNFQFLFEMDEKNQLHVLSGMNPYASDYELEANKTFTTPAFIFTYSNQGKGQASRNLHSWARNYGVLNGKGSRYTLLNNWEATQFDFNEQKLSGLFKEASLLGTDLFLLDDGWFANKYPRNDDHAGLGDWQENKQKLPSGLGYLVKEAAANGVKFGIWLEPEMLNPKSELYEKHPDWVLKLPNRQEHYYRNQLVLDIINPAVQQFVYNIVDEILSKNQGIAYIKWDCNRMMTNTYSPFLRDKQSHVYIEYVRSLYAILEKLRVKYPTLPMMLCSGGGGRTDYGALKYFTEFWPSDNTDPFERVFIQWGFSYFFPANTIACHVTSWGRQSLKYRTDVAMMGRLGYDIDVARMSEKDLQFSQQAVKNYKQLSNTIWQGNQYRLINPNQEERAAVMYVEEDKKKAVLFSYTLHPRYGTNWTPVKLQGLDAAKLYTVKETNLYPGTHSELAENNKQFTGEYLMNIGLNVSSSNQLTSAVVEIIVE
ncbi:alpha-galactosidase [Filimonas lacunae]|uniref:Alpha-galactosidase n=1 Tax=Filimonas lacunae TaxID=477680 RepID=A0A173MJX8_9BACT|nr:alpha-galactosidase [Filimonas lacunae]BAV07945.1 alpha-galactosidase [Filimonas lacunae]SIT07009.1 alpha-galactosidase [Filimonas lacunae]